MTKLRPSIVQQRYPVRYWLLVAYCVGMPSFVRFDSSGRTHDVGLFNPTSLSIVALTLFTAAMFIAMTLLNQQKVLQRRVNFGAWMWLLLLVNFVISTLLSPASKLTPVKATDLPLSLFRLGEWVLMFALLLSVYSREDEDNASDLTVRLIASACWINIGLVWCFLPIMPSLVYGVTEDATAHARLGGALVNPVHLSVLAGIAFFHSLFFLGGARKYACCGLALVTLALTYARSEQLLFLIAVFSYLVLFSRKALLRWGGLLSVVSVVALAGAFYERVFAYLSRGMGARNIVTLSERTDVWSASFKAFWERPFLGYGFIIGPKNAIKDHWTATNWVPPNSHDEFIQALITGGIVAGVIVVWLYARVLWSAIRQAKRDPQHMFFLIALVQVIGMAFITPLISAIHAELSSVFVLLYMGVMGGAAVRVKRLRQVARSRASFGSAAYVPPAPVALRWRQNFPGREF